MMLGHGLWVRGWITGSKDGCKKAAGDEICWSERGCKGWSVFDLGLRCYRFFNIGNWSFLS